MIPRMKRLARPTGMDRDEKSPHERDQICSEHNWIGPVGMRVRVEGGCGVGSVRDPFVVESDGNGKGDYVCDVEGENGDAEADGDDAASDGVAKV